MASSRRLLLREAPFALIAPIAAVVAYFPVVVLPYAYMDDYYVLAWRKGLQGHFFDTAASFGRPLHAVALSALFSLAPDINSLRFVRLASLLGAMAFAVLLYYALRRAALGRPLSAGVCVSVVTLVSFQIYVAWAAIAEAPYVAMLAGFAALRLGVVQRLHGRARVFRRTESATLLLVALLTYQPAAMFFWVFTAIDVLRPRERLGNAARRFGESLGVGVVALFGSYVAVRIGTHFWPSPLSFRTHLINDPVAKVRWFWREPIVNGLAMFNINPTAGVALALVLVAAVGIILLHADGGRSAFGFLGLAVALVPLSYSPNLVIAESDATYRSLGALASLLTLYVWLGLWGITRAVTKPAARTVTGRIVAVALAVLLSFLVLALIVLPVSRPASGIGVEAIVKWPTLAVFVLLVLAFVGIGLSGRLRTPALFVGGAALAIVGTLLAARTVTSLVVKPQSTELRMLRSLFENPHAPEPQHIVFVKPDWTQGAAPLVRYDEFGPPSSYFAWVPDPVFVLLTHERPHPVPPKLEAIYAWDEAPARSTKSGVIFVDMRKLRKRRGGWSFWTLHPS